MSPTAVPSRPRNRKLAKASSQIEQFSLELGDRQANGLADTPAIRAMRDEYLGYTLVLLTCTLPHSEPSTNTYSRAHGRHQVHIAAHPDLGLPFGPIPRLLITHIISEVRRTGQARIQLGANLARVASRLELSNDGDTYRRYKDALRRALSATYQFRIAPGPGDPTTRFRNLTIAADGAVDWDSDDWHGYITVSSDLLDEIRVHSFPIWVSFLRQLMRSPLGMDLYVWLAHQTYRAYQQQRSVTATYQELGFLFGADYASTKDFAKRVRRELGLLVRHIPGWSIRPIRGGLRINPSPPHVQPSRLPPRGEPEAPAGRALMRGRP